MDKSKADIQLEKATNDFGEFLDKLEPDNPNMAELEKQSSALVSAMHNSSRTRFDDTIVQCAGITTTLIKLELHFIRLVNFLIESKKQSQ